MKKFAWVIGSICFSLIVSAGLINYYSYVFSVEVEGVLVGVERVSNPTLVTAGANIPNSQLFSFAVAIKDRKGEIHAASSEDRQWAVAKPGLCVKARYYPYPFWQLDKSGTFFGARLLKMRDCDQQSGS